jgi:uncharacterized protein DUF3303
MLYLVEVEAEMERANEIDAAGGPGDFFQKLTARFKPQSFWGDPTGRRTFMVVELETPVKIAEMMYALTWFAGNEPAFVPLMDPAIYGEAIQNAKKLISPS